MRITASIVEYNNKRSCRLMSAKGIKQECLKTGKQNEWFNGTDEICIDCAFIM